MTATGGIRFGNFTLFRRLARGGMAEVFLARQVGLEGFDRRVAVKRILPHLADSSEFVSMFLREAKLAARLSHPNIVHIYEFGKVGLDYFIAMEFVDGVTVGELIARTAQDPMPAALVARIGADAATALHYAHELRGDNGKPLGLVHRDVSPANVMVSYDGIVKVVDFGIAKAVELTGDKTNPGTVKGKYAYMSPEQTIAAQLDGRSDVFSLSIVLWELVAGRPIVERGDRVAAMRAIRDGRLPPIERVVPTTPRLLADAISRGLSRRREDRPNAAELAQLLEAFIKASPELATSMHVASWLRQRFSPPAEQAPASDGGVMATAVGTSPGAPATQAGQTEEDLAATIPVQRMTAAELFADPRRKHEVAPPAVQAPLRLDETRPARPVSARATRGPGAVVTTETVQALPSPARGPAITAAELVSGNDRPRPPMRAKPSPSLRASGRVARADERTEASMVVRRRIAVAVVAAAIIATAFAVTRFVVQPRLAPPAPRAPTAAPPQVDPISPTAPPGTPPATTGTPSTSAPGGARVEPITEPEPTFPAAAPAPSASPGTPPAPTSAGGTSSAVPTPTASSVTAQTAAATDRASDSARDIDPARATSTGWLSVSTTPSAEVYLGTRFLGQTPTPDIELTAGTHTLTFKPAGRPSVSRRVAIRPDEKLSLNIDL